MPDWREVRDKPRHCGACNRKLDYNQLEIEAGKSRCCDSGLHVHPMKSVKTKPFRRPLEVLPGQLPLMEDENA